MNYLFLNISKYILIFLISIYTFLCFFVFKYSKEKDREQLYLNQNIIMMIIYFISFVILTIQYKDSKYVIFYLISQFSLISVIIIYRKMYPLSNKLLVNNMCMLISIGFIVLARLSFDKAKKQLIIAMISLVITMIIPYLLTHFKGLRRFHFVFSICGISFLTAVLLFSRVINGSKLNLVIFGITFQPSEYIKIMFVLAIAGLLTSKHIKNNFILSISVAFAHIILLVLSKDLGSAIIFFVVYVIMIYIYSENYMYLIAGLLSGVAGSVIGYKLFSHVRIRVRAWKDPYGTIENAGYQIAQSLFAIGTGGFFGMGLANGAPNKIPVVESDFVFSAISEEFGVLFAINLLLICISCFVMFMNIAMRFNDVFYKLTAVGLAVTYAFQVFLTIGGVTKFIPLTGVTLPLVSYGGNSILVSLIMFAIIQGLYVYVATKNSNQG